MHMAEAIMGLCALGGALIAPSGPHPMYQVVALGSPGRASAGAAFAGHDVIAGYFNLPGGTARHAAAWRNGRLTDLGTLGGPNSAVVWSSGNSRGIVTGIAQTGAEDPLGERWSCSYFFPAATSTGRQCLGFRWVDGTMTPLPTLGGTHGYATGTNNRLRTVGWAENAIRDPGCEVPQKLQFRAVIWGPDAQVERELPPVGSDTTSAATAINDAGQVVGISGACDQAAGRYSAIHAVIWEDGTPAIVPTFGGVAWNTPTAINAAGTVVGFANASGSDRGAFNPRAFIWNKSDGTKPLAMPEGKTTSQANGINRHGHVVGQACGAAAGCSAILWIDGESHDLNDLVGPTELRLLSADAIDDLGKITGQATDDASGATVAYSASPLRFPIGGP